MKTKMLTLNEATRLVLEGKVHIDASSELRHDFTKHTSGARVHNLNLTLEPIYVHAQVSAKTFKAISVLPEVREMFCLFPGMEAYWVLAAQTNKDALKYEVTYKYVNRPADPIEQ